FNEAGHDLGFEDGDRFVAIDGETVGNINTIINSLLLTSEGHSVTVERDGAQITLDIPFEKLLAMRESEGYKGLMTLREPVIVDSLASASAIAAGLRTGDEIIAVGTENVRCDFDRFTEALQTLRDSTATITVMRGDAVTELSVPVSAEGKIGVMIPGAYRYPMRTTHYSLLESIPAGIRRTGEMISSYWRQLKLIFQPKSRMYKELGGFIAIGSIFPSEWNWQVFWLQTAFLSIILAVMNILPIPGLDGGHALFTLWEMITGRKPSDRFLEIMQYIGLAIILLLLVYANGNDIYRKFLK
ncbi:MAG: site-2 protease family protein, partial [Alistipes sp.]|nr:site-2 protease family protein [Alistipes sp.]